MIYINEIIGGCLIGLGSLIAMAASGKIPGISGLVARIIKPTSGDVLWRILFLVGLVGGAALLLFLKPETGVFSIPGGRGLISIAVAGLLVGIGTRVGGGCTSGHGVCGIGAGAKDALVYTIVFMAAGAATVFLWNLITKGGVAG